MSLKLYIFLFLMFFLEFDLTAEYQDIRFRKINTEATFPSKSVDCIVQDANGYMWFGAYDGLIKYDGSNYTVYESVKGDSTSLSSRNVFSLHVDNEQRLWVGGSRGVSIYNPERDYFKSYMGEAVKENSFHSIESDSAGTIWFGTENGLWRFDEENEHFIETSLDFNTVFDLKYDNGLLYAGTETEGLLIYDIKKDSVVKYVNSANYSQFDSLGMSVTAIDLDENGNVWFVTSKAGLYKYIPKTEQLEKHIILFDGEVSQKTFFALLYVNKERILIGSQHKGFIVYNSENPKLSDFYTENTSNYSIVSNSIRYIYKGSDNTIWLATHLGGVCYYNQHDIDLRYYYADEKPQHWLRTDIVSNFTEDAQGNIWISTDGGGIHVFDKKADKFTIVKEKAGYTTQNYTDIETGSDGDIWFSPWHGAITKANPKSGEQKRIFYDTISLNFRRSWNDIKGIYHDSKSRMWIFPMFKSVMIYDEKQEMFFNTDNRGEYPDTIFEIDLLIDAVEDNDNNIWLYGFEGIGKLSPDNIYTAYINDPEDHKSIISKNIMNVFVDNVNNVWICTFDGLDRYDSKSNSFEHITTDYDFPKKVFGMLQDDRGYIWITSSGGFGRFHPDTMKLSIYEKNIGIANEEFINRSCYKASDGSMYFGGTKGFIYFNPDSLKPNVSKSEVIISEFYLFNKENKYSDSLSPLSKPIDIIDTLIIPYSLKIIGFSFAATNYVAPEKNNFAYRLLGFTDSWHYVNKNNIVTYTNLDAGTYIFQVKAANNEGRWSDSVKELVIIVTPPWWEAWWFRLSVFLVVISLMFVFFYVRMQSIKATNKMLEQKVEERTHALQEANEELQAQKEEIKHQKDKLEELNHTKDKFFSIISHDLKNPLNAMIGFAELLDRSFDTFPDEKKKKFVNIISGSSKNLFALLENLLHWARSQSGAITFKPKNIPVDEIINETISTLSHHAAKKYITLKYHSHSGLMVFVDQNMLSTVIRNLASNAIKFSKAGDTIVLDAIQKEDTLLLTIKDSGVGMNPSQVDTLFKVEKSKSRKGTEGETGTGLGLILCKEFVDRHNGYIWAESVVGKGSTFYVELPKKL